MKILIKQVKIIDPSQNFDFIGDILINNNIFIEKLRLLRLRSTKKRIIIIFTKAKFT